MVFLRSDLPSWQLTELEHPHLESVAIECTINETKWIIHAVYRPPSGSATTFYNDFSKCLDETLTRTDNILILGHLNLDYLKPETRATQYVYELLPPQLDKDPNLFQWYAILSRCDLD